MSDREHGRGMKKHWRIFAFVAGAALGVLAGWIGVKSSSDGNETLGLVAIVLGAVAVPLAASGPWGRPGAWAVLGTYLILVAVYLPALGAEATVKEWFGQAEAGAADQADAVTFARWVLVLAGVLLVAWPGRRRALEAALGLMALLAIIAAVAASITLRDRLTTADARDPDEADPSRSFALPTDRIEPVTGDLAADACARVVLVRATDEDTADQGNALTYSSESYMVRLPAAVKRGRQTGLVTVELAKNANGNITAETLATDLTAAKSVYLLGC